MAVPIIELALLVDWREAPQQILSQQRQSCSGRDQGEGEVSKSRKGEVEWGTIRLNAINIKWMKCGREVLWWGTFNNRCYMGFSWYTVIHSRCF